MSNKIILLITLLTIFSCNSVKRVMKDPKKLEVVKTHLLKQGICINDTTVITYTDTVSTSDTVILQDFLIIDKKVSIDTIVNNVHVVIKDGVLKVTNNCKSFVKTIENTVRDRALEIVLLRENSQKTDSIKYYQLILQEKNNQIKTLSKMRTRKTSPWVVLLSIFVLAMMAISTFLRMTRK